MKKYIFLIFSVLSMSSNAQQMMTPEKLWQLGRVTPIGISKDGKSLIYKVGTPNIQENKLVSKYYSVPVGGGNPVALDKIEGLVADKSISPNGQEYISVQQVKVEKILGSDIYPSLTKTSAQVYEGLDYRHWDTWNDGTHNHLFVGAIGSETEKVSPPIDIMPNEPYDAPQKPFGGDEDYVWSPDGNKIIYVCKKKAGTAYATSTNTDLYEYDVATKTTKNLTEKNLGYDTQPTFSPRGELSWLQMKRDGFEADKNDIIVRVQGYDVNLTANWDGTVDSFVWEKEGNKVYFIAPVLGTKQLFEVNHIGLTKMFPLVTQLTNGDFDVNSIVGFSGNSVLVTKTTHNRATEVFSYDLKKKSWKQITHVNDEFYSKIATCTSEKRWVNTTDGKKMLVWVILPPNFDKTKKYPTLLYCQGGPQSALTQYYSFRWNFQLMASQGYIVVAPNRRGMPGHGVQWNEQISGDWGGQVMDDYLSAIDDISKESYVDKTRIGAVGASYGGYSVFQLAGIHKNRFKTFISHCGIFNTESMYGTTEEVFFTNWDSGGAYWEKDNKIAQKTYNEFNPIKLVNNWNTPILIIQGGKDYRVPIGQGQEAFQAAQLKGIKSKFLLFPDENHWVLQPQNALVWQSEFFKWLKETL
ncbi:MAG: Prolyl oligopeptidase family protein precursor [Bacteroidota bacterium]